MNEYVKLGERAKVWDFCNVYGTKEHPVIIGDNTQIGSHCEIKPEVQIGKNCRLQNGVFIPEGVTIDNFVFIGPRVTFTNDKFPDIVKTLRGEWQKTYTRVHSYASLGAGVVVLPGSDIGFASQIGAGAIVTKPTKPYGIYVGNPARIVGYIYDRQFRDRYGALLKETM